MSRFKITALIITAVIISGIFVFRSLPVKAQLQQGELNLQTSTSSSPYFWNCSIPRSTLIPTPITPPVGILTPTATPTLIPSQIPTQTPTPIPTSTSIPTPTNIVAESCNFGGATLKKGEGVCDEKTNLVTVCEGSNQMVEKANFCGSSQVCRTQTGNYQIKCDDSCQLKLGSGDRSKADMVVLSEDYGNYNEFLSGVDKAVNAINRTNLGQARLGKINVWALLDLTQTYFQGFNCPSPIGSVVACWDHNKAMSIAMSKCGGDTYMVFNNDTHRVGSVAGIAIWGGTYIYRFALDLPTVPHELGHSMAGLVDEYSFGTSAPAGAVAGINCSDTGTQSETIPCPKWAGRFSNTGCYQRCGYTDFYRPTVRSIMDRSGSGAVYDFNEPSLVDGWDEVLKYFP